MGFRIIFHGAAPRSGSYARFARWAIAAACAAAACDGDFTAAFSPPDRTPILIHVETVSPRRLRPTLVVPGVVEAKSARTLAFRASGRIARFSVREGACVSAGDLIAEFDLGQLDAALRSARAGLVRAQARLLEALGRDGRRRRLLELAAVAPVSGEAPSIETLLYEAEVRYAQALVVRSHGRRAAGELRAPANGIVERHYRGVGDVAHVGAPVVRLAEIDSVSARASVPRALRPLVRVGGSARVRAAAGGTDGRLGAITSVGRTGAAVNPEIEFEVEVANVGLALRPGMLVEIAVAVEGPDALYAIPLAAVRRGIDGRPFSFVVVGNGPRLLVERRHLVIGGLDGERVAVVAGVAVGDRVVTRGQDLVTVGDAVEVVGEGP